MYLPPLAGSVERGRDSQLGAGRSGTAAVVISFGQRYSPRRKKP